MNINLTPLIQATIGVLAALITYRLIPWIKAHTTAKQQALIAAAVETAVFAAEQIYGPGHGYEKMDYAVAWLKERGFDVSRAEIEACVYNYLNGPKDKETEE